METNDADGNNEVVLKVKDSEFVCDRKMLENSSFYFQAMFKNDFKEKYQKEITLQDVEPEALHFIINTMNENKIDFTKSHNILEILEACCMLQFEQIEKECINFIVSSWLDKETWLPTASVADRLGLTELKNKSKTLALWNFSEARKTDHFLYLSPEELIEYLSDDRLRTTEGEFEVFEAGVNWIEFCPEDRLFYSIPLLRVVRFKDMQLFDIRNMLHFSSVKETPQAELIVECILEIKDGILNQNCESCHPPEIEDIDNLNSGKSSPLPTGTFFKNLKRKRRTTSHCTCFDHTTVKTAQESLDQKARCLPLFPCIAANFPFNFTSTQFELPQLRLKQKKNSPYMFQWNGAELVPLIHLSKIDEGPGEAMGYKVVVKDLKLYIIGGEYMMGKGDWNTSIWYYDTWKEIWQFETSLPSPRRHHSSLCVNDDLYLIGGVGRHRVMLDTVSKYNLITKTWTECAPLPTSLYSTPCCVYNEDIYLFGPQVCCYRQATANWEILTNINLNSMAVASAMTDGETIYVIGINAKLYCFIPQPENVELKFLGQFRVSGNNACLVNRSIFSFGQEGDTQSIEEYSISRKTFTTLHHRQEDEIETSTYCLNQTAGCFPIPKYY